MATRTLTYTKWLKLILQHHSDASELANLTGLAVPDVAARLDVSRQRVHQLIGGGGFDVLVITTRAGATAMTLVTEASLERYLSSRVPDRGRQGYFAFPDSATA